jgi:hypothetical protein
MCRHAYGRPPMREADTFFTIVVAMIRRAIGVLAQLRRDLEEAAHNGTNATTGHDIKPTETHLNVPL